MHIIHPMLYPIRRPPVMVTSLENGFGTRAMEGKMAWSMTYMQLPLCTALVESTMLVKQETHVVTPCTPVQMMVMALRLKIGQYAPQMPKLALVITGNGTWYVAPGRPVMTMGMPTIKCPRITQIQDSHQDKPCWTPVAATVHEVTLAHSPNQKSVSVF